jgi:GrpB-like predicted nucleotidyltransferase (UPF0157 family)
MDNTDEHPDKVTIGGQEPHNGTIYLEEYDPNWPVLFETEAAKIHRALGNKVLQLYHVGSTAVPGLCAKPVIDILLTVADSADELSYAPYLTNLGYVLRIREPERHQHRMFKGTAPEVNLHVFSKNSIEAARMVFFRDWLRNNTSDKWQYEKAKRELSQRTWKHIQDYADAKTIIIQDIMERAMRS